MNRPEILDAAKACVCGQCISCWKLSWRQRIAALVHGRVWLSVLSGYTQPPVWMDCSKTVFEAAQAGDGERYGT